MFPPFRSFHWRLTFILFLLLSTTTGSLFFLNYQIEKRILIDQIRQRALLMGKTLQLNLFELILKSRQTDLAGIPEKEKRQIRDFIQHFGEEENHLDIFSKNEGLHDLFLFDAQNKVIIDYPAEKEGRTLPPRERVDPAILARLSQNEIETQILGRNENIVLILTFPLFQEQRLLGFGRIEMSMNSAVALLSRIKFWGFITAAGLFLIILLSATYLAKSFTRPIGDLAQAAVRIGQGDFKVRLNESRKDEIGLLMKTFNRMSEGIRKLEETQKRVEKLEIAGQLAAGVAHEIKNPLNSLGLIIDHLKDRFTAKMEFPDRGKFTELTDNMKVEVERLNDIVEGFLRYAKPSTLLRQLTDLNELIGETLAFLTPEADRQQVKIFKQFERNLPQMLIDYHQIRQALINLVINALQAMPVGGEIRVFTSLHFQPQEEVIISIQDTGGGIPPENLNRLFDPYFTTRSRGFGLGLSIVDRIIQEHNGRIEVKSSPGEGATFTIFLPVIHGDQDA
ncbi:MAG: sensor histidine kinase [Nitrospiria bacterium]